MHARRLSWLAVCALLTATGAAWAQGDDSHLVFQSGFEGTTRIIGTRLVGAQPGLAKSDWEADIAAFAPPGKLALNYTGGTVTQRIADITADPVDPTNRVLRYWLADAWTADGGSQKARVQLDLYGLKGGFKAFKQSVRVFFSEDFRALEAYPNKITWLTISEFWNNEWWRPTEPYGFRITLGIGRPSAKAEKLTFLLEAQDAAPLELKKYAPTTLWHRGGDVTVPIGQWFTLEYSLTEGDRDTGRVTLAITPDGGPRHIIYDIVGPTHNTRDPAPDGFTAYNPMKLYTSSELMSYVKAQGKTLQVYWDDLKIWKLK